MCVLHDRGIPGFPRKNAENLADVDAQVRFSCFPSARLSPDLEQRGMEIGAIALREAPLAMEALSPSSSAHRVSKISSWPAVTARQ